MSYYAHIKPSGYTFSINDHETVLEAALRQHYVFPHNCRNTICGTCKGQLLEGHVTYDDTIVFALTDEEREQGYALFCAAKPLSDLVIYIEGVMGPEYIPVKKIPYQLKQVDTLSPNVYRLLLQSATDEHISYRAGQYLQILHKDMSPHPFSIANAPAENQLIELHFRYFPDNALCNYLLTEIQHLGTSLILEGPYGNATYRREPALPSILLAGGTGFAPCKAIIEQALADGLQQPMYLYWGARHLSDLYLHDVALQWAKQTTNFHYIPVLSQPLAEDNWQGVTGLVHEAVLTNHPSLVNHHVYASGPVEMVFAAQKAFLMQGLHKACMYSDWFDYEVK